MSNIQFVCPPNYATGGTESIFSCVDKLLKSGQRAEIVLLESLRSPNEVWGEVGVPERFRHYEYVLAPSLDKKAKCIVVPEGELRNLKFVKDYSVWLWWLSWDNAFENVKFRKRIDLTLKSYVKNKQIISENICYPQRHLFQSAYSRTMVSRLGLSGSMLSDYVQVLENFGDTTNQRVGIAYNARRGESDAERVLLDVRRDIPVYALKNMSKEAVHNVLTSTVLCLDLGFFPGRDKLVREAALLGNVVVTSKIGSAGYYEDFPLDSLYKFSIKDGKQNSSNLCDIMSNANVHYRQQASFRYRLQCDEDALIAQISSIF